MIKYTQGNLLEADAEALVNTVNCVGIMGKGVALQFKQAFPDNFKQYEKACRAGKVVLGKVFIVQVIDLFKPNPKYIINFPTKNHWKAKSKLEDIKQGLVSLTEEIKRLGIQSIAMPPLGCGLGGLDWKDVEPLIIDAFKNLPQVNVLLFAPQNSPKASEMPIANKELKMTRARALLLCLFNAYKALGYNLTKLEMQKIAYFLQFAGEDLKLNYVKEKYGPYADNLNHVLQKMEGQYIRGYGDRQTKSDFQVILSALNIAKKYVEEIPAARERLDRVIQLITGFETPYGVELLATVHWVMQENPDEVDDLAKIVEKTRAWSQRKEHLFKPQHIEKAWEQLKREGWVLGKEMVINEYTKVELPFIKQLELMGWKHLQGDTGVPYLTERQSFREVLLIGRLRDAIRRINLDDNGKEWLDDSRINTALSALERLGANKLMEANQIATELLLKGTAVDGDPKLHNGRDQIIRFIDFDHPENNDFLAINQFRVDPTWAVGDKDFIIPDLVLFVNGIPLVVIECKSPKITAPLEAAINQLQRYSNQRDWVEEEEGAEKLFHYNQLLIASWFYEARVGTIGASAEHYLEWKDTSPTPLSQVAMELGTEKLKSQQLLVAGMLRKEHLLDLIRNFTLFNQIGGKTAKLVARYQQFRAVQESVRRLKNGQTRLQHGESDQRGGIIWHTQGSGKSLTMVFLVRKMRTIKALRRFKVVMVTDRTDLEKQLSETATLTGESLDKATNTEHLKTLLRRQGADLVFAMIQKYQQRDTDEENSQATTATELFPELNVSADILVLVDEAHRSQASDLHANLMRSLPNCAKIGFTGTPIIVSERKKTHEIFGSFIDRYTIKQSEYDGATVPILYEGRTAEAVVANGQNLDQVFEDMFPNRSPQELEAIKIKYATSGNILEAPKLIEAKAADMLRHYIDNVLPNRFKAQIVSSSRLAAIRYQKALVNVHQEIIEKLVNLNPALLNLSQEAIENQSTETQFLIRAHQHLEIIQRLESAAIISADNNDDPAWQTWSDKSKIDANIERFKRPLVHSDETKQDGLAFLCVKSMLITGFDAPFEQVLYLDRFMQGHELLQAIARVNRTSTGKTHGLVVDYYGVAKHLKEALAVYNAEDIQGALISLKEELPKLDDRHRRVLAVFQDRKISSISDVDECVDLLRDVEIRAEFVVKLKQFLESLETVLPRPEALYYKSDAKLLGFINKAASNLYRDGQLNLAGAGQKVRQLIDQYIIANGIDPKIPPISIMDAQFEETVEGHVSNRSKASEMEHAARYHINKHFSEDPAYYKKLSERLEDVLQGFEDNWQELVKALREFTKTVRKGRPSDETGLHPRTQAPFLGLLLEEMGLSQDVPKEKLTLLAGLTIELVEHISQEIRVVDFWRNLHAQGVLRTWIVNFLDDNDVIDFKKQQSVADRITELAKALHSRLTS